MNTPAIKSLITAAGTRLLDAWCYILDLIYPPRCVFCREMVIRSGEICPECRKGIEADFGEFCSKCCKSPCICHSFPPVYDGGVVFGYYRQGGTLRAGVLKMKGSSSGAEAGYFAVQLSKKLKASGLKPDFVVPVPSYNSHKRLHEEDHAEVLAKEISRLTNTPYSGGGLVRRDIKGTYAQHLLNKEERGANAVKQYGISKNLPEIEGKSLLLCDDIITTGATLNRCAALLKSMGAHKVYIAAVVVTMGLERDSKAAQPKVPTET